MDNFEEILRVLAEDTDNEENGEPFAGCEPCADRRDHGNRDNCGNCDNSADSEQSEGLFSGLDPELLIRLMSLMETLNQPDDNERFLLALRPLLREENRPKIDSAVRLLRLMTLLPFIRESGFLEKLM